MSPNLSEVLIFSDELANRLPSVLELFRTLLNQQHEGLTFLETALRYVVQATDKLDETILRQALPDVRGMIMPTIAETWIEQGVQKGLQQGMQQGKAIQARAALQSILTARFGSLAEALQRQLAAIDDLARLEALLNIAATATALEDVQHQLSA